MAGFDRLVRHLATYFNLSDAESRRLIAELSNGILVACVAEGSISLPRLGEIKITDDKNLTLTTNAFARTYLQTAVVTDLPVYSQAEHRTSQPDKVRQSLFTYLGLDYPTGQGWQHPQGQIYSYEQVSAALSIVRRTNIDYYDIFYARLLTSRRRDTIATAYQYSEASVKRRCDSVLASILFLLVHPELTSDSLIKFYQNN